MQKQCKVSLSLTYDVWQSFCVSWDAVTNNFYDLRPLIGWKVQTLNLWKRATNEWVATTIADMLLQSKASWYHGLNLRQRKTREVLALMRPVQASTTPRHRHQTVRPMDRIRFGTKVEASQTSWSRCVRQILTLEVERKSCSAGTRINVATLTLSRKSTIFSQKNNQRSNVTFAANKWSNIECIGTLRTKEN